MLLEESLKEFLFECEVRKYTWKTIRGYRNGLNFLVNYLKQEHQLTNLEDIQTRHLKAFFMWQSRRGRKETYLNGLLKTFRAFFKYQMGAENITTNPVLKVSWMKEPKTIIKTFRDSEVKGMLQAYSGSDYYSVRNRAIMAMLFDTGIRCYELCTLSKAAIKDNYIVIYGKGKKERQVGKSPYLAKILMKYDRIKEYNFEFKNIRIDNYFLSRTGRPLTNAAVDKLKNDYKYANMYKYKEYDARGNAKKKVGFVTNSKTKPLMINNYVELFETNQICINSKDLLSEMKLFAFKDGKMEATFGNHDDLVMSMAMALEGIKSGIHYI